MMTEERKKSSFSIDDGEEERNQHDQLPNAEELKIVVSISRGGLKSKLLIALGALVSIAISVSFGVTLGNHKSRDVSNPVAPSVSLDSNNNKMNPQGSDVTVKQVITYISNRGYSELKALQDTLSPQRQAVEWLLHTDTKQIYFMKPRFLQRYILLVLYFSTGGPNWHFQSNFADPKRDECNWSQSFHRSDGSSFEMGIICNHNSQVNQIVLDGLNLVGTIPPEVGFLNHLFRLSLDNNKLSGNLPKTLIKPPFFSSLTVGFNDYDMEIPTWIGQMSKLRVLGLAHNNFRSTIPTEFVQLRDLYILALDNNLLSGNLDTIQQMKSLSRVYLHDNAFTDTIDDAFMSHLVELRTLDLSNNKLQGTVSFSLLAKERLEVLALHTNFLTGSLPSSLPESTTLFFLSLHKNELVGRIPDSINNFSRLQHLHLSSNNFDGDIPSTLKEIQSLHSLYLADNPQLRTGPIPPFIENMGQLKELSLQGTHRTGAVPTWFGNLPNLVLLDLSYNELQSTVPSELGQLNQLRTLRLNGNELTGTLPSKSLAKLRGLMVLLLNNNTIRGTAGDMCQTRFQKFVTDCLPSSVREPPELTCSCCTYCCSDFNRACENDFISPSIVPATLWYRRFDVPYQGSLAVVPSRQGIGK